MRHRLPSKKNWLTSAIFLTASCSPAPQAHPIFCHGWTKAEKIELRTQVAAIPSDTALDAAFRDYEAVCGKLELQ